MLHTLSVSSRAWPGDRPCPQQQHKEQQQQEQQKQRVIYATEWVMASVGDECVRFPMKCNFMAGILYLSLTDCRTTQLKKQEDKRRRKKKREKGRRNSCRVGKGKLKVLSAFVRLMAGIWSALHTNNFPLTAIPSLVHFYCYLPIKNIIYIGYAMCRLHRWAP